jgi:predicted RNA polymerase sigma factor
VPEPTVAQRIVRAKRTLAEAQVPVRGAARRELAARLRRCSRSSTSSSTRATRRPRRRLDAPELCEDALRSGASSPELVPSEPRCTASSRSWRSRRRAPRRARPDGEPILLSTRTARAGTGS